MITIKKCYVCNCTFSFKSGRIPICLECRNKGWRINTGKPPSIITKHIEIAYRGRPEARTRKDTGYPINYEWGRTHIIKAWRYTDQYTKNAVNSLIKPEDMPI